MTDAKEINEVVNRLDGFLSSITGIGNKRKDPTKGHDYFLSPDDIKTQTEVEHLFYKEGLAARIVEVLPKEMLKKGIRVDVPQSMEIQTATMGELKRLRFIRQLLRALINARLYGGGALLLGLKDGLNPEKPVDLTKVQSVMWVNVLHRYQLTAKDRDEDPMSPTFDQVLTYQISGAGVALPITVHASRLLKFVGVDLPEEVERNVAPNGHEGWGESVLVRTWDPIRRFVESLSSVEVMIKDFHQTTIKLKQLIQLISSSDVNSDELVQARLQLMVLTKSIFNAYVIDENDSVSSSSPNVTGLDKLFELLMLHLASVAQTPLTKLFGRSPAGMNATGESDEQSWIELVVASQEADLRDPLERFLEILYASKDGPSEGEPVEFSLVFPPPRDLSESEQASVRKTQSEVDKTYVELEIVTKEEVTMSRFGGPVYSTTTVLNTELREEQSNVQALGALVEPEAEPQPDDAVTLRELASEFGMSNSKPLQRMGKRGLFKIWRAGNTVIVSRSEVIKVMANGGKVPEIEPETEPEAIDSSHLALPPDEERP